ncbi:amino acid adenylation domain-containing protein [Marinactinospora thermotolerans DSM 45154]|uniref:Amino acid adenylation domain-containing protein n=1 Tax=Marinactinospora thermotolerans DSM 45154 TaxID=1122192 RepID=A0A1T4THQ5_9ACTN|nr:AMP-binding protein [Marinactinospora thermotolerans]SKA39992.1 amino acid adenylation domain-containing protein [Marinactinospora thermotolerans DSM 45154]
MTPETPSALYSRFRRGLSANPDGAAFRAGNGGAESLTYAEADRLALLWAGALLRDGRPAAVGILAAKGTVAYVGVLAGLYAGVPVVPLGTDLPVERIGMMAETAGVEAVIADQWGATAARDLTVAGRTPRVLTPGIDPPAQADALDAPRPVAPSDVAYVLFTSGSTGRPKGVPITHANTDHYFRFLDTRYDFTPGDVFSQTFDLTFDCAMFDLFCAWGAGATVVAVPMTAYRDLPAFIAEQGITVWFSTPSAIGLTRHTGRLTPGSLPGLRWSLFAGEALKEADATDWLRAASSSTLENLYGPTEMTITITAYRWDPATTPGICVNGLSPIGEVNDGHDHLLIGEDGRPAEQEGELWISGPQLTPGYLDPRDAGGRFVHRDGRTWYNTGDRVRRARTGDLVYLGRADSQVQIQGRRVELTEIDHALRATPGVTDAATVAVTQGEEGPLRLVAFYTGAPARPADLAAQAGRTLPAGLIPRTYVHLDGFPLNHNRKVDRARLRTIAGEHIGDAR